jgi:hypothetical protein
VSTQKLDGKRFRLVARLPPDTKIRADHAAAEKGLSISAYVASLIDADTGVIHPDSGDQGALEISA